MRNGAASSPLICQMSDCTTCETCTIFFVGRSSSLLDCLISADQFELIKTDHFRLVSPSANLKEYKYLRR